MASSWEVKAVSQEQAYNRFAWSVVVPCVFLAAFFCVPLYGWQAWVAPINFNFSKRTDGDLTFSDGIATFVSSLAIFIGAVANFIQGPYMMKFGFSKMFALGALLSLTGLLLTGAALQTREPALLYVGFGLFFGIGTGLQYLPMALFMLLWFTEINQPGLGSGLVGFIAGLWPAIFAYAGPALISWLGVYGSIYALAVIFVGVSFIPIYFMHLPDEGWVVPVGADGDTENNGDEGADTKKVAASSRKPRNAGPDGASPLARKKVLQSRQFAPLFLGFFIMLSPGFGQKLVTSVVMTSAYNASLEIQNVAAFIFLIAYAVIRLGVGYFADKFLLKHMFMVFGISQTIGLLIMGFLIWKNLSVGAFIFIQTLLVLGFAGSKVLMSIVCLYVFGAVNSSTVFGMMLLAYGCAAVLGPISMWGVVSRAPNLNTNTTVQAGDPWLLDIAIWFWVAAAITPIATGLIFIGLKQYDFESSLKREEQGQGTCPIPEEAPSLQ